MQYHKEGRALRTETTLNNTRNFILSGKGCLFVRITEATCRPVNVTARKTGVPPRVD